SLSTHCMFSSLFFYCSVHCRVLHSFPTRRSSDLDVGIGLDVAATQFVRDDVYELRREGLTLTSDEMVARLLDWLARYPIVSVEEDRKSTRLNSSHGSISYAVFCLKKKKTTQNTST